MLPALKPIMMRERVSLIFIEYGQIDVIDNAFVVIDKNGVRTHIPIGGVACIMLEPGTRVSHAAAALAARVGTLSVPWCKGGLLYRFFCLMCAGAAVRRCCVADRHLVLRAAVQHHAPTTGQKT